jgi:hypothetical protein
MPLHQLNTWSSVEMIDVLLNQSKRLDVVVETLRELLTVCILITWQSNAATEEEMHPGNYRFCF